MKSLSIIKFNETFKIVPNRGDGNCLFLAVQYFFPTETHLSLRKKVADYYAANIQKHRGDIFISISHGKKIRDEGEWGEASDVFILGEILDVTINVFMINNDNRYKGVIATQLPEKDKTINILLQGNHYEALSIKDGKYLHLPEDIKSNKREKEKENTRKKIHQEKSDRKLVGELQLEEDMKFAKFLENVENRGGTRKKSKRKSKRKRLQRRATWKGKYR